MLCEKTRNMRKVEHQYKCQSVSTNCRTGFSVGTEEFGDLDVDSDYPYGSFDGPGSDCEDFARNIVRHWTRYTTMDCGTDACLKQMQQTMRLYYPMMVLLAVTSKEINSPTKDVKAMGAHMNVFLVPKQRTFEMMSLQDADEYEAWKRDLFNRFPLERDLFERSRT